MKWSKLWELTSHWLKSTRKRNWLIAGSAILAIVIITSSPIWAIVKHQVETARYWMATPTADITVTATPIAVGTPEDFTVEYISDYEMGISWTKPPEAVNTMVRAAIDRPLKSITDGYLVYYGEETSATDWVYLEVASAKIYYGAWSEDEEGTWSPVWAEKNVEGIGVTRLTDTIYDLAMLILAFIVVAALVGLAYWHRDRWLYIVAGLACIVFAVTFLNTNWYIGFLLILFGVYNFFKAAWDRGR